MDRVTDLADPRRCKAGTSAGQCMCVAPEGSDFCVHHSGVDRTATRDLRQYLLIRAQDQTRLAQLNDPEGTKSLRDEVVIATGMLERRLNLVKTDAEFIQSFPQIERFFKTLADLKKASFFLEEKSGAMLSRAAAFRVGQEIIKIVVEELDGIEGYEQIVDRIIERIVPAIQYAQNLGPVENKVPVRALPAPKIE